MYLLSLGQMASSQNQSLNLAWLREQCSAILTTILADEEGSGVHAIMSVLLDTPHCTETPQFCIVSKPKCDALLVFFQSMKEFLSKLLNS